MNEIGKGNCPLARESCAWPAGSPFRRDRTSPWWSWEIGDFDVTGSCDVISPDHFVRGFYNSSFRRCRLNFLVLQKEYKILVHNLSIYEKLEQSTQWIIQKKWGKDFTFGGDCTVAENNAPPINEESEIDYHSRFKQGHRKILSLFLHWWEEREPTKTAASIYNDIPSMVSSWAWSPTRWWKGFPVYLKGAPYVEKDLICWTISHYVLVLLCSILPMCWKCHMHWKTGPIMLPMRFGWSSGTGLVVAILNCQAITCWNFFCLLCFCFDWPFLGRGHSSPGEYHTGGSRGSQDRLNWSGSHLYCRSRLPE